MRSLFGVWAFGRCSRRRVTDLSSASQALILEQAAAVGDAQETTQLREQLQTFIRERLF
jgi:hypothetical protein